MSMFSESVVTKTGQLWKVWLGLAAMVFGSVAPALEASGISWTLGTIISMAGYVFALAAIRCPKCGQRWFWKAAMHPEMYGPLLKEPHCPQCAQGPCERLRIE